MNYDDYKNVRDNAWLTILKTGVNSLPIDLFKVCRGLGIHLCSYEYGERQYFKQIRHDNEIAFSTLIANEWFIFYNADAYPYNRIRFAVGHEIGHIVCKHHYRADFGSNKRYEEMADRFSIRLLTPAIVLHDCHVINPNGIMLLCDITYTSAEIRAKRINELEKQNRYGTSKLEKRLRKQFKNFVQLYEETKGL